jgi:hypothetical protein
MVPIVTIKPLDIIYMLDDEDLASMRQSDLQKICTAITLDLQLERERGKEPEKYLA